MSLDRMVHPAAGVEIRLDAPDLGVQRCTRCHARLGLLSVVSTNDTDVTCTPADPEALKRARLRDLLDDHAAAKVDFERAQRRVDDAWAAVQRFLAGAS